MICSGHIRHLPRPDPAARLRRLLMGLLALLALALGLAVPGTASAADFVFTGRGWGSGVGMSQWGAWGAARDGKDFRWILDFYYPGTTLESLAQPDPEIRVKISSQPWLSVYSITQNYRQIDLGAAVTDLTLVKDGASGESSEVIPAGSFLNVWLKDGKVFINTARGEQGPYEWVEARPASEEGRCRVDLKTDSGWIAQREYWGKMRVVPASSAGHVNLYNIVRVEKYLRSIGEVEYDWGQPGSSAYALEAVKAQAVAARTYAVANQSPYLDDNQWDQAYLGYITRGTSSSPGYCFETRFPGIPQAAEQTAGLVLTCYGAPIQAYFSAHSGGYTTAWEVGAYPYLQAKADPYSLSSPPTSLDARGPGYPWTLTLSAEDVSRAVEGIVDVNGSSRSLGSISRVEILSRDTDDSYSHVARLRLTGSRGSAVVSGTSFRRCFGYDEMRSTLILSVTGPPTLPPGEFYDLTMYGAEIKRVVLAGLMNGYPNELFKPEASLTRWQFAKIAVNLYNLRFPDSKIELLDAKGQPFWDVPTTPGVLGDEGDWVAAAREAALMNGVSATNFRPYEPIRRDELASVLVRALGVDPESVVIDAVTPFEDVPDSSAHYQAALYLKAMGVLRGYEEPAGGGRFYLRPEEPLLRMHSAAVLARALDIGL